MNTTSTFAEIKHIDDLVPYVRDNVQIRVKTESNGMTVVCYMLQDEDTFDGLNQGFERECRGITFNPDGTIAARTLHKFFNVGEREDTQHFMLDWSKVVRVMDKRDGSMVTPVFVNGELTFKTKKSFDTKEAALAKEICLKTKNGVAFCLKMSELGLTPTFEVTSPKYPIVLKYDKDELTLLHVRENVSGRYLTEAELSDLGSPFPIVENIIDEFKDIAMEMGCIVEDQFSWYKIEDAAKTREGIEGWIIQFEDGGMVKVKTKWYIELHHSVTFTRWRDIARTVLADQADDLKGAFMMTGRDIEPILTVERQIKATIEPVREMVQHYASTGRETGLSPKDMALNFKDHAQFGLIMNAYRGKEINWLEWYEKNFLDSWSLEVV